MGSSAENSVDGPFLAGIVYDRKAIVVDDRAIPAIAATDLAAQPYHDTPYKLTIP